MKVFETAKFMVLRDDSTVPAKSGGYESREMITTHGFSTVKEAEVWIAQEVAKDLEEATELCLGRNEDYSTLYYIVEEYRHVHPVPIVAAHVELENV